LYLEFNRDPDKKFYVPRRSVLKPVVDALQDLEDDKVATRARAWIEIPAPIKIQGCRCVD